MISEPRDRCPTCADRAPRLPYVCELPPGHGGLHRKTIPHDVIEWLPAGETWGSYRVGGGAVRT